MNKVFLLILFLFFGFVNAQNQPPVVTGSGNQPYCPLSQIPIVENFDITDPDDTTAEAIYIQISSGYEQGQDILLLIGFHPNINASWNSQQGKLTLSGVGGAQVNYTDFIAAVYDVVFQSSSTSVIGEKYFSITLGEANYLPSNGHYYEYVPNSGISWTQAYTLANNSNYYGLQGYLATITSQEEADLCGEQAASTGWIGGSDSETEGVWKWMNGPELGVVFWNGLANGSTPNYANWNNGEPNNLGDEDYAHITDCTTCIDGSWNDLPNTGGGGEYFPQGYVVEYGGTPGDPTLQISASTSIYVPEIVDTQDNSGCGSQSVDLSATASSNEVLWFDVSSGGLPIAVGNTFSTPVISTSTTYYVLASANGCTEGQRTPVTATIYPLPLIDDNVVLKNCDEDGNPDGITEFNLHEADDIITFGNSSLYTITYYESFADADLPANEVDASPFVNDLINVVYARVETTDGCHSVSTVNLQVSTTSFPPNYFEELNSCDDDGISDGFHEFDLTSVSQQFIDQFPTGQNLSVSYYYNQQDAQLEQNEILNTTNYINQTPFAETLYVRVESDDNGDCFGIGPNLNLNVYPLPTFEVYPPEDLCLGEETALLEVYNADGDYSYQWLNSAGDIIGTDESINVYSGGVYSVTAISSQGCVSNPVDVIVEESSIAQIGYEDVTITNFTSNNTITIDNSGINLGVGDYEFALDHGLYQDEPLFENIPAGEHLISVRDKNGCGVATLQINVMGFPKFFTPNGDGYHDTWNIIGFNGEFTEASNVRIFDRYGKLIKQISLYGSGWNGIFNDSFMQNDDYWYVATLISFDGNTQIITGHFTLKR